MAEYLPETELLCVGDRESDIFELFDHRRRKSGNIQLLVRARYNRCLEEHSRKLFDHLDGLPSMAKALIEVPRHREKKSKPSQSRRVSLPARTARVQLKWDKVTLATPQTRHLQVAGETAAAAGPRNHPGSKKGGYASGPHV
jgi:hypothetical protein